MPRPVRSDQKYLPGLDGLRALAVTAVIAYHLGYGWAQGGLLGVGVFFTLSGYLITDILVGQFAASGRVKLGDFWLRRARRLLPALFVMLAVVTVWVNAFNRAFVPGYRGDVIASGLYVNNWWYIFQHDSYYSRFAPPAPLDHLWSLAVEEQFYLVWPWVVLAMVLLAGWMMKRRRIRLLGPGAHVEKDGNEFLSGRARWAMAGVALALAVASAIEMAMLYHPGYDPTRVYEGTDTRAFALLIGAAVAMVYPTRRGARTLSAGPRWLLDAAGLAGLVVVVLLVWRTNEYSDFMFRGGLELLSVATALVVAAAATPGGLLGRALGWTPMRWIGVRSYGIYLWHYPIIVLTAAAGTVGTPVSAVRAVMLVAVTVAIAAASWRFVEDPIRRGSYRRTAPAAAGAGAAGAAASAAGAVGGAAAAVGGGHVTILGARPRAAQRPTAGGRAAAAPTARSTGGGGAAAAVTVSSSARRGWRQLPALRRRRRRPKRTAVRRAHLAARHRRALPARHGRHHRGRDLGQLRAGEQHGRHLGGGRGERGGRRRRGAGAVGGGGRGDGRPERRDRGGLDDVVRERSGQERLGVQGRRHQLRSGLERAERRRLHDPAGGRRPADHPRHRRGDRGRAADAAAADVVHLGRAHRRLHLGRAVLQRLPAEQGPADPRPVRRRRGQDHDRQGRRGHLGGRVAARHPERRDDGELGAQDRLPRLLGDRARHQRHRRRGRRLRGQPGGADQADDGADRHQPVMWVEVKSILSSGPYAESNMELWDQALQQALPNYPNMRLYNWPAVVQRSWFINDGIHYTSVGYAHRGQMIAEALAEAFPAN